MRCGNDLAEPHGRARRQGFGLEGGRRRHVLRRAHWRALACGFQHAHATGRICRGAHRGHGCRGSSRPVLVWRLGSGRRAVENEVADGVCPGHALRRRGNRRPGPPMGSPAGEGDAQRVHGKARGEHVPRPGLAARKQSNQLLRGGRDSHGDKMHAAAGDQQEARHRSGAVVSPLDGPRTGRNIHQRCGCGRCHHCRERETLRHPAPLCENSCEKMCRRPRGASPPAQGSRRGPLADAIA